jgi:hypothetical protein
VNKARIIMGAALGLAAIAVTIDHMRHRTPAPAVAQDAKRDATIIETPCGSGAAPCESDTRPEAPGYGH